MLITLYTPVGIIYQKFTINETDIIYGDLIKYINIPKNELYDEFDLSSSSSIFFDSSSLSYINLPKNNFYDESTNIYDKVFVKTIINLFSYNQINSKEIKLDDEINGDINEFTILFSDEYYVYHTHFHNQTKYKKLENNIKNYNNIDIDIDKIIKNDPYQIMFIDCDHENYEEICKLAVKHSFDSLQCIKEQNDEICKLACIQHGYALKFIKPELITDEICKLAVSKNGLSLQYVIPELMTDEICKLAVSKDGYALQYVIPELMTDEICKLAVQQNFHALQYVIPELMTDEICKLAFQQNGNTLKYVKEQTDEICKLAVQQNGIALVYVKEEFKTPELLKLIN